MSTSKASAPAAGRRMSKPRRPAKVAAPAPAPADEPLDIEKLRAEVATEGVMANAGTVRAFSQRSVGDLDPAATVKALRAKANTVHGGDLKPVEAMLMAQATSLNAVFNELARRASLNLSENLDAAEKYLRLGLKAQAQSRAALQALVEAKTPRPITLVRQANVAQQQVVNNAAASPARTEEPATAPNELLPTPAPGGWVDAGLASATGRGELQAAPR